MGPAVEPRQLAAGTMLDDKYRIEGLIAFGGMGAVYHGTHVKLRKKVAIKVLNPQLSSAAMIERFHREAITASQIGHEGIAQVTDIGTSVDGEPFLVMEYLEGESLATRLRNSGALPIDIACELACEILSPLAAAHASGIVHRDLKPDNVFLVRQSRGEMVKLLDFGISRTTGHEADSRLTTTGLVLGTPYYMSPEQARGDSNITPAADLYALGVILYEMLIGAVPIEGENYNQLMYRVITGELTPPRQRRGDVPEALERVILHAMALEPAQRPASATDLEHALLGFCRPTFRENLRRAPRITGNPVPAPSTASNSGMGTEETLLGPAAAPSKTTPSHASPAVAPPSAGRAVGEATATAGVPRRARTPIIAAVIGFLGIAAAAGVIVMRDASTPAAQPGQPVANREPPPAVDPPAVAAPEVTAPPPVPPAEPADPTITLRFDVDPPSATIMIDGKPIADAAHVVRRDEVSHRLRITAPGYAPHTDELRFDESQKLSVVLKKTGRPRNKPRKPQRIDDESPYK